MLPFPFPWLRVGSRKIERKDTAAMGVELMRGRISHDNAETVSHPVHLTVGNGEMRGNPGVQYTHLGSKDISHEWLP